MQAMSRKEGQGSGGQHVLGDDRRGVDQGGDGLDGHMGSWQRNSVAGDHGGVYRAKSKVTNSSDA